jgi:hypothetical protein
MKNSKLRKHQKVLTEHLFILLLRLNGMNDGKTELALGQVLAEALVF